MPDMDMGETINSDMDFEEAVTALLNAGRVEEAQDENDSTETE